MKGAELSRIFIVKINDQRHQRGSDFNPAIMATHVATAIGEAIECLLLQKYLTERRLKSAEKRNSSCKLTVYVRTTGEEYGLLKPQFEISVVYSTAWSSEEAMLELQREIIVVFRHHGFEATNELCSVNDERCITSRFCVSAEKCDMLPECLFMSKCLHRINIAHPEMLVILSVTVNGENSLTTYKNCNKMQSKIMDNKMLATNIEHYSKVNPSFGMACNKIFLTKACSVQIPCTMDEHTFDDGYMMDGQSYDQVIRLIPATAVVSTQNTVATAMPCFSFVKVFVYLPASLPALKWRRLKEDVVVFFENPHNLADWSDFDVSSLFLMSDSSFEGTVDPDIVFSTNEFETDLDQSSLLVFLFFEFTSTVPSSLPELRVFFRKSVQILARVLPANILNIKKAIGNAIKRTLLLKKKQESLHLKAEKAIPIITEAIHTIVASSTNGYFRTNCLQMFKATYSKDLAKGIQKSLQNLITSKTDFKNVCQKANSHSEATSGSFSNDENQKNNVMACLDKANDDLSTIPPHPQCHPSSEDSEVVLLQSNESFANTGSSQTEIYPGLSQYLEEKRMIQDVSPKRTLPLSAEFLQKGCAIDISQASHHSSRDAPEKTLSFLEYAQKNTFSQFVNPLGNTRNTGEAIKRYPEHAYHDTRNKRLCAGITSTNFKTRALGSTNHEDSKENSKSPYEVPSGTITFPQESKNKSKEAHLLVCSATHGNWFDAFGNPLPEE
uniref:uncharacterized protein n=1 Tax=Myxine glutinosa TaxID=7769 RepID=UPI00358EA964